MKDGDIKAFILVGGLGTRLREVVSDVPKPMAPIDGKPFLYYKVMQLKRRGIRNIVFCSGYLHEIIEKYFSDGSEFGLKIEYSVEKELLGTGGAVRNAEEFIDGDFILMNGDVYIDLDYKKMLDSFYGLKAKYMMALKPINRYFAGGIVTVDNEMHITSFIEKPGEDILSKIEVPYLNIGVYVLNPDILDLIPAGKKCSIERDVFPKLIGDGFYGYEYTGYFIDIGVPENYKKFKEDVKNRTAPLP